MDFEVRHIDGTTVKLISSEHKCAITSATQTRKLCGNDTVTINLQSATYIEFYVGDKITIFGTTYTLNQLPTVKKESERSYTYTLVFEGLQYTLIDRVFLMPDNTQGDNLMFDLAGMLDVLDDNINRGNSGKQYEFVLDDSLEETEYKNLSLTGKNCLQVLQQLCQEWNTEFVFAEEPTRIAIYIGVAGSTFPTTFKYGRGGGVYELNREKGASDICTRLFVYGGTQNLTYYRHNRLCLPSKEKNQSYVEDATAQAVYGIKEQVKNFDDIYPNRIGTITSLSGCDYNEFIDSAMADAEFGFDLNEKWANNADDCAEWLALKGLENTPENEAIYYNDVAGTATKYLMAGATAKIHFNTGALAGYECDLHSYTHSNQKFVLKPLVDENGYDFPSKTNAAFKLAVGDEYVILDINLPTAYKEEAESKLATEAASYFDTVCRPQPKYTLTIEPIALKHIVGPSTADTEIFKVGDLINISDPTGGVESATIRIDQFVRNLLDPFDYKLTLTDEITYSQQVRTLIEVDAIKRVVEESKIYDVNRIRRGWKDAEELYNQMFDTEGHYYSEKIAPLSIDTQMLKVGARSQQLVLQNVLFQPNYNANPANLQISAGSLVHYTIAEPDIKTWTMSAYSGSNLPSTAQYVYAKCARNGTTGTWLVTDQAIIFDSDPSYYHFLVGSLSSVDSVSNTRNFAATYGFTTINGRNITTGVIKSADGSGVIIDLDAGIIKGNITFESGTTSYDALQGIISGNSTVQGAVTTANRAEGKIDGLEIGGRNLVLNSAPMTYAASGNGGWRASGGTVSHKDYSDLPNKQWTGAIRCTNSGSSATSIGITQDFIKVKADADKYFALSCYIRASVEINEKPRIQPYWKDSSHYAMDYSSANINKVTTSWQKCYGIAKITGSYEGEASLGYFYLTVPAGAWFEVCGMKVEYGTKATDWSPAPEDVDAGISSAQTAATNAQQAATNAQTTINNMDSDSYFSTVEKKSFRPEWKAICGVDNTTTTPTASSTYGGSYEQALKAAQGTTVSTTALTTAFGNLRGHLNTYKLYTSENTNWGTSGQTTLATYVKAYYNAEQAFYDALADYWSEVKSQQAVDNLQIGGRNLITNTGDFAGQWSYQIDNPANTWQPPIAQEKFNGNAVAAISTAWRGASKVLDCKAGEQYTFSAWLKSSASSQRIIIYLVFYTNGAWGTGALAKNGYYGTAWTLASVTITIPDNTTKFLLVTESVDNTTYYLSSLKTEKGNKATDWSPAPEDGDAEARARLNNIDSDSVFSIAEKEAYRTDFEKIVGVGIAVGGTIPTATQLNNSTYAKGSYYQHYTMINSTATNTLTALSQAYTNLRDYLVGNTCLLYTQQDTSGFSRTSLAGLICAYLDAEKAIEIYAENVGNMKGTISTEAATDTKVVNIDTMDGAITANMARDMLADADMRMAIVLSADNTALDITLQFYYASGSIIPTGRSWADCYLQYLGVRTNQKCYWKAKMVLTLQYDTIDNSRVRFKLTDEENFATVLAFGKAMQGKTTVAGGLVLTETIVAGEGSGQSGMSGANASDNVAFWAGGSVGAAMTYNVPVVIMRDGTAKFGLLRFNNDTISFADETGQARLNIVRGTVPTPTASAVKRNNNSTTPDSPVWSSLSGSGSLATLTTDWAKVFDIGFVQNCSEIHNGMPVHVRGSSSNTFRIQTTAAEYAAYSLTVYIRIGDDNVIQIYHADYLFGSQDINVELQDRYAAFYTSGSSGSCALVAEAQSLSGNISLAVAVSNLQDWYYHDSSKSVTTLASDGLGVIVDNENHLVTKEVTVGNQKRLETTIKGLTDIPGVLWAGEISSAGVPTKKWANSSVSLVAASSSAHPSAGVYKFTLSGVSSNPIAIANVIGSGSNGWSAKIDTNTSSTIQVRIYNDNSAADSAFNLLIIGSN